MKYRHSSSVINRFRTHHLLLIAVVSIFLGLGASSLMPSRYDRVQAQPSPVSVRAPQTKAAQTGAPVKAEPAAVQKPAVIITSATIVPSCTPSSSVGFADVPTISSNNPGVFQNTTTSTYTVYGTAMNQIANQIHSCSPVTLGSDRFAGSTTYRMSWTYSIAQNQDKTCTVDNVSVGLGIHFTMPSWEQVGANSAITGQWETFYANLFTHEQGHATIARQHADAIVTQLRAIPPMDCNQITTFASAKADAIRAQLDAANEQYDASTNHGDTQGAHF
ncbi:MAG: DUF922 domain-containing protein [Candidatus Saccharibacteria bacterium]